MGNYYNIADKSQVMFYQKKKQGKNIKGWKNVFQEEKKSDS